MPLHIVIGALYGDEGKGRVVQALSTDLTTAGRRARHPALVVRATGGANASHTVFHEGHELTLRQVPCGVFSSPVCTGDGMVLIPLQLVDELAMLAGHGVDTSRVRISERAVVVTPLHRAADRAASAYTLSDDEHAIGTTQQGVGPALVDKAMRTALRFADLDNRPALLRSLTATLERFPALKKQTRSDDLETIADQLQAARRRLGASVVDTRELVHRALSAGKDVLVEGAQGSLLDVDHGAWPFVTATHPSTGGVLASLGVGPALVESVVGVARAFMTRQARGPLVTEIPVSSEAAFRQLSGEQVLRVGWLDAVALRGAARVNGFTELIVTNVDRVTAFPSLALATRYLDDEGRAHRFWPRPEAEPAGVRYVRVKLRRAITVTPAAAVAACEPFLARVAKEVGVPIRRVSASPSGAMVRRRH